MNARHTRLLAPILAGVLLASSAPLLAQSSPIRGTKHNLSVSGPGDVRSTTETQICKFCHIPHSPVALTALWGHSLSNAQYVTSNVRTAANTFQLAPQPDGSSRLCLSCHDGTVALGDLGPRRPAVPMASSAHLVSGQRSHLGLDLSGSHPISFALPAVDPGQSETGRDIGVKSAASVAAARQVHIDQKGRMQCTTCHDPHSDANYRPGATPHFWVKPTVSEVCLACHEVR